MSSALNQYIDLWHQNASLLNAHSAPILNDLRLQALQVLEHYAAVGLPRLGSEDYRLTDLETLFAPNYGLNLGRRSMSANPAAAFRCDVPSVSTDLCLLINDSFARTDKAMHDLPEGVLIGSLAALAAKHPHIIKQAYGAAADMQNPVVALNTLLAQDGLLLYVPRGVKLHRPLQLVSLLNATMPLMAVRRLLILLEDEAEAQMLVCDHTQTEDIDFLSLQVVEIILGKNARLDFYDLEESTRQTHRISTLYAKQQQGSRLLVNGTTLYNGFTRNEYRIQLNGENAETQLLSMGIADLDRKIDMYSLIDHTVPQCHSNELVKYSADDNANCAFAGRILVQPGAHHTDSYQSNRNLLGSTTAKIYSKPQLEIYNDDVKCSHGSATGQLDAGQLFYMRTRGIDEHTAKLLLKQAFMADILDSIQLPGLRERLHMLVERRFAGTTAACASCASSCQKP